MTFVHRLLKLDPITNEDLPHGRYYDTPGGRFPSVTTVISRYKGDDSLRAWRERVGEEEAKRVSTRAKLRGTAVHQVAENYIKNDPNWRVGVMPSHMDSFLSIKKKLDEKLGVVYSIEAPLWSSTLRTAGRTDLVGEWDGVPSIIDYKTSKKIKKQDEIFGYFVQETCYALMVEERVGLVIPQIVTLMMVDHEQPSVFIKKREEHEADVEKIFVLARRDIEDAGKRDREESRGVPGRVSGGL